MTDSPVPPTFLPLTDLELAQITADLAPMGFTWGRVPGLNGWNAPAMRTIIANEGQGIYGLSEYRFNAHADKGAPDWAGFDSHISAATWLLLQDTQRVCSSCNGSGRVKHHTLGTSTGRTIYAPCPACIGEYVKV